MVIYETIDGLVRVQELLKDDVFKITLRQLPPTDDYRQVINYRQNNADYRIPTITGQW